MSQQELTARLTSNEVQGNESKRLMCQQCLRAQKACICHCVQSADNTVDVLILQHPQEAKHIKSSGRLLRLCLRQSRIEIGEQFAQSQLREWLSADGRQSYLLYPEGKNSSLEPSCGAKCTLESGSLALEKIRIVVIDASWRQSRQMLRDNPLLETLPRYALSEMPASRYVIRQAHQVDQLSSLEACTYALMRLENEEQKFQTLLQAFDAFNQLQIDFGVQRLHRS
ncbi:DTW domain-containing protein [Undibacterium sp. LX40W]|uniref:tRNA-uridine aminocarboxypropyltransferase n=1 Tax=Undibacterium nitidum TaxID=2762298 RepID=A0A923HXQ6_9BURK|nr:MULTISPECIES: tRNA-uridine aminocarboxypropyltransferase [Undibacterium]MBC3882146.1 DTW domain-containing protein [Undibacterium nitidum]MBC3892427.1 DTW domain-containing protein [Undibacterium sp. LX40W]